MPHFPFPHIRHRLIWCLKGICSGKHAIAEYLIQNQGFRLLELKSKTGSQVAAEAETDADPQLQASATGEGSNSPPSHTFDGVDSLLEFATKNWQELWVTADIWEGSTLDRFLQRPFFLLVSVDAPVSLRWKRSVDRSVITRTAMNINYAHCPY